MCCEGRRRTILFKIVLKEQKQVNTWWYYLRSSWNNSSPFKYGIDVPILMGWILRWKYSEFLLARLTLYKHMQLVMVFYSNLLCLFAEFEHKQRDVQTSWFNPRITKGTGAKIGNFVFWERKVEGRCELLNQPKF